MRNGYGVWEWVSEKSGESVLHIPSGFPGDLVIVLDLTILSRSVLVLDFLRHHHLPRTSTSHHTIRVPRHTHHHTVAAAILVGVQSDGFRKMVCLGMVGASSNGGAALYRGAVLGPPSLSVGGRKRCNIEESSSGD